MAAAQTVGAANATQAFLVHLALTEFAPRSAADMALARSYSAIVTTVSQAWIVLRRCVRMPVPDTGCVMARPEDALASGVSLAKRVSCRVVLTNVHITAVAIKMGSVTATMVGVARTVHCKYVPLVAQVKIVQATAHAAKKRCAVVQVDGTDLLATSSRARTSVKNMGIVPMGHAFATEDLAAMTVTS